MFCQGVLDEVDAAKAIFSVLSALEACHTLSICYGDVKPGNFLLTSMYPSVAHLLDPSKPKGDLKLKAVDFGCAEYCPEGCSLMQGLSGTPGGEMGGLPAVVCCCVKPCCHSLVGTGSHGPGLPPYVCSLHTPAVRGDLNDACIAAWCSKNLSGLTLLQHACMRWH
jgi:serine/threonine protein kinase